MAHCDAPPVLESSEHAHRAPADEAVVEPLLRPVAFGGAFPLEAIPDHIDDATHYSPAINTSDASFSGGNDQPPD